ncbi:hypothetical protein N7468_004908 [Penicillium chermesinum]|uniref:Uncharacterized protein n=1 Tax=Penicillium chermesinum TaxID=63820 RepID=A0A9W9P977_9EURO|nr:uncharacterized protein N7468_004908 [Penicillium chermesinum]KAJ5240289.1 hypothetical protein N7468_004908 [Penicillium chermesinum]
MAPPVTRSRSNDPGRMTGDAGTNTPRPPTPTPGAYPDSPEEQREEVEQSTRRDERVPYEIPVEMLTSARLIDITNRNDVINIENPETFENLFEGGPQKLSNVRK